MTIAVRATAVLPSVSLPFLQREQRQLTRRLQIALPVLVMDRQRLDGKLPERGRRGVAPDGPRFGQRDELPPVRGGFAEPAVAPAPQAEPIQAFAPHLDGVADVDARR